MCVKNFHCQHHTRSVLQNNDSCSNKRKKRTKNTDCLISLILKVNNEQYRKKCPANSYFEPQFPCEIHIEYEHNHPTLALNTMSFLYILETVKQKMSDLFKKRYPPAMLYAELKSAPIRIKRRR